MKRTISFMTGKGSVNHNSRKFHAKNTDPQRSRWNVEYCNQDIREVYHELFDGALERYNAKQTRKDRKIEDYYEKIRSGKQEKPFHEIILQIGNKDDMGAKTAEGQMAAKILDEYMKGFQERNPTLRVFSAHLHMDEATPHLHIDFVPYITGSKRGLDTRVSLKQALSALGFKGGTRMETELNQWVTAEKQQLASIMLEHGIEWEQKGTHEKHLSLLDFEKQERAKEVAALEKQKAELKEHNANMQEVNEKWLDQLENIEREISSAHENREEADKQADQAKKKIAQYEKKLTEMAPMVKDMERFAEKYSADSEEILPEAGTLEMGKAYREKKAKPLIKKIVTVLRSVYRAYLDLSRRFSDMQRSYERAWNKVNSLTARVEELWNENRMLRENLGDFERVKGALGHDTIETIVQAERLREQEIKEQKRAQRRKMNRGAR
nr:plasmid recombination protein [Anaerostipes sp. CAG:276]